MGWGVQYDNDNSAIYAIAGFFFAVIKRGEDKLKNGFITYTVYKHKKILLLLIKKIMILIQSINY